MSRRRYRAFRARAGKWNKVVEVSGNNVKGPEAREIPGKSPCTSRFLFRPDVFLWRIVFQRGCSVQLRIRKWGVLYTKNRPN